MAEGIGQQSRTWGVGEPAMCPHPHCCNRAGTWHHVRAGEPVRGGGALLQPECKTAVLAGNRSKEVFFASCFPPVVLGKSHLGTQLLWGLLLDTVAGI